MAVGTPGRGASAVDDTPDFINVFKLCGLDQMTNATREGDVTTVVDRGLGRKVVLVTGNVPAANFVRVPKIGKPALGLTGRYVYAQVKLDPERFFAVHVDCICVDPNASSGKAGGSASTGFTPGRTTVRLTCSNLYKRKSSRPDPSGAASSTLSGSAVNFPHEPPARKWHVLVFDTHGLVKRAPSGGQENGPKRTGGTNNAKTSSKEPPRFDCVKSIQLGGGCAVRNVFVADELYDAETLPKDMHLSSKPGVDVTWHHVGGVDPSGGKGKGSKSSKNIDPLAPPADGPTNKAIPPTPSDPSVVSVPHTTNMPTTPYATQDDATIESRTGRTPVGAITFDDEEEVFDAKKTNRPSSPPLVGHTDASLDQPPSPPRGTGRAGHTAATQKPIGKPRASRYVVSKDPRPEAGFFGDGGAGGLRSSSRPVSGAHGDVDKLTGMPYAVDLPPAKPLGADVAPALVLSRIIGLTGEFPGASAWAPDGRRVAYPVNSVVAMHDTRDGTQTHLFGHTDRVHLLCFGRDGRVLVTGQRGRHPVIKVWDVQTGQCVATLYAHASGLKSLDVSPDGTAVVAAGTDTSGRQMIAVWDIGAVTHGGFAPMTLRHRTDYHVNCVRFSPFEEDHLVTCGKNSIRTYRLRKGQLRGCSVDLGDLRLSKLAPKTNQFQKKDEFELNDFTVVAFEIGYGLADLNQKRLFCATVTGAVVQVNYGKRQLERVFQLHDGKINDLRVAEGFAVTASDDKFLRVWPTDFSDFFLEAEHESAVTSCSVSSDGLQVCASTSTGSLGVLDIPSHAYRTLLRSHAGAVTSAAFDPSPDRDEMATCSVDGTARVWDCATGEQLYEFVGEPGECACSVAYRPQVNGHGGKNGSDVTKAKTARALAVGFSGGSSRVYDVETTAVIAEHRQHKGDVVSVQFTPDGSRMITAGGEGNLCVYDAKNGYLPVKYLATALPTDRVRAAVSPDGKLLATIGPNGETALVFETDSLKLRSPALVPPRHARTGGKSKVRAFAFSPDGKSLTVANDDGAVSRHDVSNEKGDGAPIAVCRGVVSGSITSLAVDASGTVVVVGGEDKSLSAVPLSGMREPFLPAEVQADVPNQSYSGHWGAVSAVAFDAATRCVTVGGGDAVYVWDVDARAGKALAASKPRDHVSFAEPTSEDTADTYGSDSDDGSVPTLSDGSDPGDDLEEEVPAETSTDAFAHKPKLAATPSKVSSRGILKKHEKSPPKSALKTDGRYGSAASTPVKGPDPEADDDAPAADKSSKVRRSLADMPVEVLVPKDRPTEKNPAPGRDPTVPKQKVAQPVLERAAAAKKPVTIRPTRVIGLSTGASAAGNEATESAAAVAAATAAAPALYIPELGSVLFAAGCDVVVERVGGERQQALLRRHPFPITALAHHPETRRIASASASEVRADASGPGECVVCIWDASTGACLKEMRHERAGGCIVSLQFSPEGALLLSAAADPDGALRVWDVATGTEVLGARTEAPVASVGWCVHSSLPEFVIAGADGVWLHSLADETGTTGSHTVQRIAFDDLTEKTRSRWSRDPVCTALCVGSDGSVYVGDSRGSVWRSSLQTGVNNASNDVNAKSNPAPPSLVKCADALPDNEAVTVVNALPGGRLFVGGARRARVWINELHAGGWEEVGELELDGAVVAANFDASTRANLRVKHTSPDTEPWGVVTTSAGSAWLVEIATGTARALAQAHPLDVANSSVKSLGSRVALATCSVDGTARVWDCDSGAKVLEVHADASTRTRATRAVIAPDGTKVCIGCGDGGVGVVGVGGGGGGAAPGVQGPVRHAKAHPSGAAVVHAVFLNHGPLLTVAADGSVAVTNVANATAEQLFPGGKADTDDPVVAASVSEPAIGSGEILVSLARSSMLQCVSIVPGVKSELKCSFKPAPRGGSYVTAPGMCAWSETSRGIVYYASRATGGRVVQFDALKSEVVCVVDVGTGRDVGGPWCLSVVEREGCDGLAVGTAVGVEFVRVNKDGEVHGNSAVSDKERGACSMAMGARHVAWTEDGVDAWVCSGTCAYLLTDPFGQI